MINRHLLIGNLGKDPEVRTLENGTKVANFSLATTHKYKGNKETDWHNIVVFGKGAEIIEMFVHKGDRLYVEGRSRTRSWDDKDGNKRYTTEVLVDNFQMLDGKKEAEDVEDVVAPIIEEKEKDDLPF